jgi:hypothetical protein
MIACGNLKCGNISERMRVNDGDSYSVGAVAALDLCSAP